VHVDAGARFDSVALLGGAVVGDHRHEFVAGGRDERRER